MLSSAESAWAVPRSAPKVSALTPRARIAGTELPRARSSSQRSRIASICSRVMSWSVESVISGAPPADHQSPV
jgi:hypothetical protein